ncbi:MAG: sugar phosphate isomerase/epimerase [Clostridia bacterium]|nr:sugar phosphate isomerase/epimerase [Clostridia bacterium]
MRFGGMIFGQWDSPEQWAERAREMGYTGVYFPVDYRADTSVIDGYVNAAREADLVISEIGIWNNLMDRDEKKRSENLERAVHQLELADYISANCCVNIAGSYSDTWDGPHRDNLTPRAFDEIVQTTQRIIDAVRPKNTYYTLEPMPWMYPDSADSYLSLLKAVDRPRFAAHVDIVNVLSSPQLCYRSGEVIREWFDKLGPFIRSCHAKDIRLDTRLTVHLDECRPGLGEMDYETYVRCVSSLRDDRICLMLEHMTLQQDYVEATRYIKGVAEKIGVRL